MTVKFEEGDVVRVVPAGRKNRRLVRVGMKRDGAGQLWYGWLCNERGGDVVFAAKDVLEVVPDPYA